VREEVVAPPGFQEYVRTGSPVAVVVRLTEEPLQIGTLDPLFIIIVGGASVILSATIGFFTTRMGSLFFLLPALSFATEVFCGENNFLKKIMWNCLPDQENTKAHYD
jgi:hypothetical protein